MTTNQAIGLFQIVKLDLYINYIQLRDMDFKQKKFKQIINNIGIRMLKRIRRAILLD